MSSNIVSEDEIPGWAEDLIDDHPVVRDDDGVLRFKANPAVEQLVEIADLNELWVRAKESGEITQEDMEQLYRQMGYSLSGFKEVFGDDRPFGGL